MTADPFDNPQTKRPTWEQDERGIWRDRFGRPGIIQPGKTTRTAYTRASTMAGVIDDYYAINQWAQRGVAVGLRRAWEQRSEMLAAIPFEMPEERDEKEELDEVVAAAKHAAGCDDKAERGTYLHSLCEAFDNGQMTREEYRALPEVDRRDVAAYVAACREWGLRHLYRECFMVNDARKLAGTPDGISEVTGKARAKGIPLADLGPLITDLKTGSAEYGAPKWHAQLADYAESVLYDPVTDQRLPTPAINQEWALVIHLPAGTATVNLVLVDLAMGRATLDLAQKVRNARNWGRRVGALPVVATYELPEEIDA